MANLTQLRIDSAKALGKAHALIDGEPYTRHVRDPLTGELDAVAWQPDKEGHEAQLVELFAWLGVKAPYKLTDAMFHLGKLRSDWKLAIMRAVAEALKEMEAANDNS